MQTFIWILLSAFLASTLTAVAVVLGLRRWWYDKLRAELEAHLNDAAAVLRAEVQAGVEEGIQSSIHELPQDVIRSTTRTVTQTGMDIVEEGISTLLGSNRNKK